MNYEKIDAVLKEARMEFPAKKAKLGRSAARYNTRQLHGPSEIRSVAKPKRWRTKGWISCLKCRWWYESVGQACPNCGN